ncbi:NADP-dependent malic enzyme [Granulosicoccus antarcticus]|uniref:NADP-dependent malic enzyme n=1 Tax=Granulosicoccus antarcticus IMCC3135 TaxID=1192854 RepID=A0A2Z2P047_9GAMM|nr:NADP-dependent malic enzyme [Granulosicoccus antarcticus]ASJ75601.1 NADP-dependent malic enzyme [Granulosicoccus antarcticus IMCC3135]
MSDQHSDSGSKTLNPTSEQEAQESLAEAALNYHRYPTPGKLEISATKNMLNQRDLALAYSPGVAAACNEIVRDPLMVAEMTARSNLVAVITNGTAVLGLGAIGALASKPVMEGKAVLFKKFANVDVFDLELDTTDVDRFCEAVELLEPTFGGINLEDIKAPECFIIEKRLREKMNIPVFHDDQHGTAIVVAAAIRNGLKVAGKELNDIDLVCSGAGAAALACLNLLVFMGLDKKRVSVCDEHGVLYEGRNNNMDPYKAVYARDTEARTLDDVIGDADVFLGLSAPNVMTGEQVARMAASPFILALANPDPEISPAVVHAVRDDAIMATGRSDYPNQVNNVLCFPFLFRGALDVGATEINGEMQAAAVEAIAGIANKEASDVVSAAYGGKPFRFGREYLIPKPFDPRLMMEIPEMVARAAMASGVATRPIQDFEAYRRKLSEFIFRSGLIMKPVFERAQADTQRIVLPEGESLRVLNAVQILVDDAICHPILLGRPEGIQAKIEELGLRLTMGEGFTVIDPENNPHYEQHVDAYHRLMERAGVSPRYAANVIRTRMTALGAVMVREGQADALVCGTQGAYARHLKYLCDVIGIRDDVSDISALMLMILDKGSVFLTDTHVTVNPSAEELAETAFMASKIVRRFGMVPKIGMLSHSNFGSRNNESAVKMRTARKLLAERHPEIAVEGEMHADAALSQETRDRVFPNAGFAGAANLLVMPNLDAANIAYNMVKVLGDGVPVGPMLMGLNKPAHVVTESTTVRGIVNLCAIAAVDAIDYKAGLE